MHREDTYISVPVVTRIMDLPDAGESSPSETEQPASSVREHTAKALVEEYTYLLEDTGHIEDTSTESNVIVVELLELLTNAYGLQILYHLFCEKQPLRFTELEDALGISPKVLSQRLKELVEVGLVSRQSYDEIPPRVEYEPTAKAKELDPAFQFLYAWAERHDLDFD